MVTEHPYRCQEQPHKEKSQLPQSWPSIRSGDRTEALIQEEVPGAKRQPRCSPPAETIMVYDSELTRRLARSKWELEHLFKSLSKNLSTCGWKIMSFEPRQSPALCEFDTMCSLKINPCTLITRKEKA